MLWVDLSFAKRRPPAFERETTLPPPETYTVSTEEMPSTTSKDTEVDHDWAALAGSAVGLTLAAGSLMLYPMGVFMGSLTHAFGWTRGQVSAALTVGQITSFFATLFWGFLLDRFGPRRTVLPSAIGLGIGTGLLSLLTPHLWHFYFMFGVIVFVAGAASPLGYAGVLVRRFDKKLGLALGIALMGSGLGAAVLPSLSQILIAHFGWRMAYAGLGGLAVLVAGPAAFIATRNTRGPIVRTAGVVAVPVFPFLRTRAFLLICSTFFLLATASVGSITHFVPMMTDRGFTLAVAARVAGLIGISTLVSRGVAGWLLDRLHAPYLLAFVASMCAVSSLVLAYAGKLPTFATAAIILGVVGGAEVDIISFLIRRYFGPAAFGRLYSVAFAAFLLGPGPVLIGYSYDRFHQYRFGLFLCIALSLVAAALALAMPRYEKVTE